MRNTIRYPDFTKTKYESNVPLLVSLLRLLVKNNFLTCLEEGKSVDLGSIALDNPLSDSPFAMGESSREWQEVFKALKD